MANHMRKTKRRSTSAGVPVTKAELAAAVRRLERRLAAANAALEARQQEHERALIAVRRAADRRLAAMVHELAALRHHEARATALERLLNERTATVAVKEPEGDGEAPRTAG
jgi:hypothetical protein